VAVRFEGFAEMVARSQRDLSDIADRLALALQILSTDEQDAFSRSVEDFPLQSKRVVFRVILPRTELFPLAETLSRWENVTVLADAIAGAAWVATAPSATTGQRFLELASMARDRRGHAIIFSAPAELKRGMEVWGESPPTVSLMRSMKHQFDPKELLNPGRFLGGI
ncbi:MAG TPA: FAD-linked oxidase C-terminal domain-containing protein, partial [Phototrophicaceae bacterium]|nr:FAD-linked oxidase C-terminal domain-containing protein [Phototrophicaceae bacterium]